jgi:hypothetical protein
VETDSRRNLDNPPKRNNDLSETGDQDSSSNDDNLNKDKIGKLFEMPPCL